MKYQIPFLILFFIIFFKSHNYFQSSLLTYMDVSKDSKNPPEHPKENPTPNLQNLFYLKKLNWELDPSSEWQSNLAKSISSQKAFFETTYEQIPGKIPFPRFGKRDYIMTNLTKQVHISAILHSPDHLNILIRDPDNIRWEIPFHEPYPHPRGNEFYDIESSNFEFIFKESPFQLTVKRKSTQEIIFDIRRNIIFSKDYLELVTTFPSKHFYGMGERIFTFQFTPGEYSLFVLDRGGEIEDGTPGHNVQGQHPMYLMKEKSNKYHITFLRNLNSQEFTLKFEPLELIWVTIGGIFDLNFFLGDENPENVVKAYHNYLGGWAMPAFWHMGYHLNKWWGYENFTVLKDVLVQHETRKIPLDALWSDLDYLHGFINFQIDTEKFPLEDVAKLYKDYRKRWIPVINAFIPTNKTSPAWEYPNVLDLALKDQQNDYYKAKCWSKDCYVIDFNHPKTNDFWDTMIKKIDDQWKMNGIWIDANEISDLCASIKGYCAARVRPGYDKYFDAAYWPSWINLYWATVVPPSCVHYDKIDEFNLRPLMGSLFQAKFSFDSMKKRSELPFVLSRCNTPGTGRYAFHWLADINSNWISMRYSLGTIMSFGLFGIPFSGTDVCGMIGENKTESELCARWYQVGVFYPFSRNAHSPNLPPPNPPNNQEPYTYEGVFYDTIYRSILLRYSLLKYYYSLFIDKTESFNGDSDMSRRVGMVFKPLFFVFYDDKSLPPYGDHSHDNQVMIGDGLMAAPVLQNLTDYVDVFFPDARWYDLRTLHEMNSRRRFARVSATLYEDPPYFLRGGHIFFRQDVKDVMNSDDLNHEFDLYIGLGDYANSRSSAEGFILNVPNYSEKTVYENCLKGACGLRIKVDIVKATIEESKYEMRLSAHSKGSQIMHPIKIKKIFVMGLYEEFKWSLKGGNVVARDIEARFDVDFYELDVNVDIGNSEVLFDMK